MKSGYCQPLDGNFRLAWIWWISLLAFQQVLYFENNLKFDGLNSLLLVLAVAYLYFLIRQRRFFVSKHHLYFTKDFRLNMLEIDLAYISGVRLSRNRFEFNYAGKLYHYLVWGSSHRLLKDLLGENEIAYTVAKDSEIHGS